MVTYIAISCAVWLLLRDDQWYPRYLDKEMIWSVGSFEEIRYMSEQSELEGKRDVEIEN